MYKNFIETTEDCFKQVEKFPYKVNYMKENLGLPEEYDGFKIAYIDENIKWKKGSFTYLYMDTQHGVIYGDI